MKVIFINPAVLALGLAATLGSAFGQSETTDKNESKDIMIKEKITQTAGRMRLGNFAPKFAELNDDVLFGEVWNRPGLSPHDRSMITIAALIGKGVIDSSLKHHCSSPSKTASRALKSLKC